MKVNLRHIYLGSISIFCSCMLQAATVAMSSAAAMSSSAQTEQFSAAQTTGKSILEIIQALNKSLTDKAIVSPQHQAVGIALGNTKEKLTLFEQQLTGIQTQLSKVTTPVSASMHTELATSFEQFQLVRSQLLKQSNSSACQPVITAIDKQFAALGFSSAEPTNNTSSTTSSETAQPTLAQSATGHTREKSILDGNEDAANLAQAMGVVHQETASQSSVSAPSDSSQPATTTSVSASESMQSSSSSATLASALQQTTLLIEQEDSDTDSNTGNDQADSLEDKNFILKKDLIKTTAIELIKKGTSRKEVLANMKTIIDSNQLDSKLNAEELYREAVTEAIDTTPDKLTKEKLPELVSEWITNPPFEIAQFAHLPPRKLVSPQAKLFCDNHKKEIRELFEKAQKDNKDNVQLNQQTHSLENSCALIAHALFHSYNAAQDSEMSCLSFQDLYNGVAITCIPERDALGISAGDGRPRINNNSNHAAPFSSRTGKGSMQRVANQQRAEARKEVLRATRAYDPNLLPDNTPKPIRRLSCWERFKRIKNFCSSPWAILGGIGLAGLIVFLIVRSKYPTEIIV